uniref:Uncharacterized protein n=1 Tax=Dulem virus 32 TaxID=3145750 RepID=A0AAU8B2J2_9CAUD
MTTPNSLRDSIERISQRTESLFRKQLYFAVCLDEACPLCEYPEQARLLTRQGAWVGEYCRNCGASCGNHGIVFDWLLATGGPLRPGCGPDWRDDEDES